MIATTAPTTPETAPMTAHLSDQRISAMAHPAAGDVYHRVRHAQRRFYFREDDVIPRSIDGDNGYRPARTFFVGMRDLRGLQVRLAAYLDAPSAR